MIRPSLVRPLEPGWQRVLDTVLRPIRRPELTTNDVARLAPAVKALSAAYNGAQAEGGKTKLPLEARVAFSFPRDVPKGAAAVRELIASGVLAIPTDRPLRVLDLGAGLGAMTWGLVRALEASGAKGRVDALLVDEDQEALRGAEAIARAATSLERSAIELAITTKRLDLASGKDRSAQASSTNDVVILGQVLSEISPRQDPAERLEAQSAIIADVLRTMVAPDGALVIVEPALRDRTRHLHALRDRILEQRIATVFAPCLHAGACPMLPLETEWCHEDLPVDLPDWVVPLARAAGLRWQGLTFSYLVLRKDGKISVRPSSEAASVRFRTVSDLLRSKGKAELLICAEDGQRRRIRRLDRDAALDGGLPFTDLRRGDIVTLSSSEPQRSPIDPSGRVEGKTHAAIDVGAARK